MSFLRLRHPPIRITPRRRDQKKGIGFKVLVFSSNVCVSAVTKKVLLIFVVVVDGVANK